MNRVQFVFRVAARGNKLQEGYKRSGLSVDWAKFLAFLFFPLSMEKCAAGKINNPVSLVSLRYLCYQKAVETNDGSEREGKTKSVSFVIASLALSPKRR